MPIGLKKVHGLNILMFFEECPHEVKFIPINRVSNVFSLIWKCILT